MKTDTIRKLENVLHEMEKGSGPTRDPDRYFFSVFGEPGSTDAWGWRYEGHHVSLNWTFLKGKVIASSPQFFGSNPGEVLGATAEAPGLPNTGNGATSQTLPTILALIASLGLLNIMGILIIRKANRAR